MTGDAPWWRGAVVYQIYPRSFADSDGDGTGDLRGITERLPYLRDLGVDGVWISPFFTSPQADYGYDVQDYRDVDPMFGTLADADALIARAHELGLKVMVDLVLSHTSDRHPWFDASRQDRSNSLADWYVWADPRADGTAPNNWLSVFGGPAWQYDSRRDQYYLHNFLVQQPDLNLHQPAVVAALLDVAKFWLDRGVDGFRLDAIDFGVHDPELRDNPVRPPKAGTGGGMIPGTPFARQLHAYQKGLAELRPILLTPLRRLADGYGEIALLGELSGERALDNAARYTRGTDGMHMAYTFDLLACPLAADAIGDIVESLESKIEDGWPAWSFSNHDVIRAPTRFGGEAPSEALCRLLPVLLTCLRGTLCLYQGEELGLSEADIAFEDLQDPYGKTFWPRFKGRDGCRTPMPWSAGVPSAGFTVGQPWLPIPEDHARRAVDVQAAEPTSTLTTTGQFLAWRRRQPALRLGDFVRVSAPEPVLAFERRTAGQRLLCAFNLSGEAVHWPSGRTLEAADALLSDAASLGRDGAIDFPGYGVAIAAVTD